MVGPAGDRTYYWLDRLLLVGPADGCSWLLVGPTVAGWTRCRLGLPLVGPTVG